MGSTGGSTEGDPSPERGVRALLANRRYALYLVSRVSLIVATQMLSVAVGWQVYEITGQALALSQKVEQLTQIVAQDRAQVASLTPPSSSASAASSRARS